MGIDPSRIKVVSSEKILEEGSQYDDNLNQRYYDHQIVISPSTTNDDIPPSVLLEERLFNNASAQARLK